MKNLPFTLEDLILLRSVLRFGGFRKASQQLGISQPAITSKIKMLEKNLGLIIFLRTRPISLTESGVILYKYSDKILFLCEELFKTLEDFKVRKDVLIVGASQTVGTYLMPQILGLFNKKYSEIDIKLEVHSTRKIAWMVASGYIDFAIIGGNVPKELKNTLEIVPYAEDELGLIVPRGHPLCIKQSIKKEELYRLKFITLNRNSTIRKTLDNILDENGIDLNRLQIIMELNTIEALKNAVQCGLGVAFVSISAISKELEYKTIFSLNIENIPIKRRLSMVIHPNRYKTNVYKTFINEVSNFFSQLPVKKISEKLTSHHNDQCYHKKGAL